VLKGRFLLQDWMTSLNPQGATNIHRINHDETILTDIGRVIIPARCGQQISTKHLALLSDQDAENWALEYSQVLVQKYGKRKYCRWC
jgi:hypothetical protein